MKDPRHIDEDWQSALCVVAHPDDLEFGTAAAVARWTEQGKTITYAMVTSGEAGIDALSPADCRRVREAEQVESARIVGVSQVDFLGLPDGVLEYAVPLRRAICQAVRRHRPEIVITNNFRDTWGYASLNQADHIATGKATLDAIRDAGNRWVFAEQLQPGVDPWGGSGLGRRVSAGDPRGGDHGDLLARRRLAGGAPRVHRRARLGRFRPREVPGRRCTAGRHMARGADGHNFRGVLDRFLNPTGARVKLATYRPRAR